LEREEKKSGTGEAPRGNNPDEVFTVGKVLVLADAPAMVEVGDEMEAVIATVEIPASKEGAGEQWDQTGKWWPTLEGSLHRKKEAHPNHLRDKGKLF
jgi:hypothetical protein